MLIITSFFLLDHRVFSTFSIFLIPTRKQNIFMRRFLRMLQNGHFLRSQCRKIIPIRWNEPFLVQNRGPPTWPISDVRSWRSSRCRNYVIDCVIISDLIQMSCSCSLDNPLRNMLQTIMSAGPVIFEKSQRSLLLGRSRPSAGPKFGAGRCHGSDPFKQGRTRHIWEISTEPSPW